MEQEKMVLVLVSNTFFTFYSKQDLICRRWVVGHNYPQVCPWTKADTDIHVRSIIPVHIFSVPLCFSLFFFLLHNTLTDNQGTSSR